MELGHVLGVPNTDIAGLRDCVKLIEVLVELYHYNGRVMSINVSFIVAARLVEEMDCAAVAAHGEHIQGRRVVQTQD